MENEHKMGFKSGTRTFARRQATESEERIPSDRFVFHFIYQIFSANCERTRKVPFTKTIFIRQTKICGGYRFDLQYFQIKQMFNYFISLDQLNNLWTTSVSSAWHPCVIMSLYFRVIHFISSFSLTSSSDWTVVINLCFNLTLNCQ